MPDTDDTIETPLSSGATDNPDAAQSGDTQANNEASATAAGYPVQHASAPGSFDVAGARKAGYSDDEILQHLTSTGRSFDVDGATKAGYSKGEIIQHLATMPLTKAAPNAGLSKPALPNPIQQNIDEQKSDRAAGAAGPLNKPGAAEKAMGENTSELDTLKSLGTATAATAGGAVGAEFAPEALAAIKTMVKAHPVAAQFIKKVLVGAALGHELGRTTRSASIGALINLLR
jgi:hypothetical protein